MNSGQSPILDSDGDGLPDLWETANGFDRFNAADAALDSDGDGRSNIAEYLAGTDPRNPASAFTASAAPVAGGYRVSFPAMGGKTYSVQFRDGFAAGNWLNLPGAEALAPSSSQTMSVTDSAAGTQRFYRVITPAQQP